MTPYARALDAASRRPDFLDLANSQFHPYGYRVPPAHLRDLWEAYLDSLLYRPDPRGALPTRQALSAWYQSRGLALPPSHFFLASGTSELYVLLFRLLCSPTQTVALPRPSYPLFEHLAALAERAVEYYELDPSRGWALQRRSLERLSADVGVLVLIEPNNPTGRVYTPSEVAILGAFLEERGVPLLIDEVFEAYTYREPFLLARATDYPNTPVFTLNGLSKRWASPDLKVAWCAASGQGVERYLDSLETALDALLPVSEFSATVANRLITMPEVAAAKVRIDLIRNWDILEHWIGDHPGLLEGELPRGGIHWMPRSPQRDDEALAIHLLQEWGLHVQPGYLFDLPDEGYIVLSLLLPPDVFLEGLERLRRALAAL